MGFQKRVVIEKVVDRIILITLKADFHSACQKAYSDNLGTEVSRSTAKEVSYYIIWGAPPSKIMKALDIDKDAVEKVIDCFWKVFQDHQRYLR